MEAKRVARKGNKEGGLKKRRGRSVQHGAGKRVAFASAAANGNRPIIREKNGKERSAREGGPAWGLLLTRNV